MTSPTPSIATIRSEAQALASAGSWPAVAALLAPLATGPDCDAEVALLYAQARMRCGQEREALDWLQQVVGPLARSGDRGAHRRALNMLGAATLALGRLDDAVRAFEEVLDLATEADDLMLIAQASNNLGAIANLRGEHLEALSHYRLALPTLQRLGQAQRLGEAYHNIAISCRDLGELEQADEHERRAIDYAADAGAPRVAAMGRVGRAEIALRRGDAQFAEMTAALAAEEFASLADPLMESDARRLVGASRVAQGRTADALAAFGAALAIAESRGHALNQAEVLRDRVEAWAQQGAGEQARTDAARAIELFTSLGASGEVERLAARVAQLG